MESVPWFILALLAIYLAFSRLKSVHLHFEDREDRKAKKLRTRHHRKLPPSGEGSALPKGQLADEERELRRRR